MGSSNLLGSDELQQNWPAILVHLPRPLESRADLFGVFNPLGVTAHSQSHVGIVATQIAAVIKLVGGFHGVSFYRHRRVVQNNRRNRYTRPHRSLEVQPGHTKGCIAHKVDAHFLRRGQLGTNDQSQSGSKTVGLAPTKVSPGTVRAIEGSNLIAGAARIMGDDGILRWHGLHELPNHTVGIDWPPGGGNLAGPLGQPGFAL